MKTRKPFARFKANSIKEVQQSCEKFVAQAPS